MSKGLLDLHGSFEKRIKNIFQIASYISFLGNLMDIKKYAVDNNNLLYINLINNAIILLVLVLFYTRKLHYKVCFSILIYSVLVNIIIGKFATEIDPSNPLRAFMFLRDSIFVILLLSLAAFSLHKIHTLIIGALYLLFLVLFDFFVGSPYIHQSILLIAIVFISYIGLTYYLVNIFEQALLDQQVKNQQIKNKNFELNDSNNMLSNANRLLRERQVMIEEQSKRISSQTVELKEKNDELGKINASKDLFFSIIAHDLKNPFNVIKGYAELLKSRFDVLDETLKKQYIDAIEQTSIVTYNLLENLLTWARIQNNSIQFSPDYINLNILILEVNMLFKDTLKTKNINLQYQPNNTPQVFADSEMVSMILRNLISNAIKFSFPGGEIKIELIESTEEVKIIVSDNGIGISQEDLSKMFKIDKHLSSRGTSGETGTGLGLILCKLFIEKNNGQFFVDSELKVGTKFSLILPRFNTN